MFKEIAMMRKGYFVYVLANIGSCRFFISVTTDLERCLQRARRRIQRPAQTFWVCHRLLLVELYPYAYQAYARERALQRLTDAQLLALISLHNPEWQDFARWYNATPISAVSSADDSARRYPL